MSKPAEHRNPKRKPVQRKAKPTITAKSKKAYDDRQQYIAEVLDELWNLDPDFVAEWMEPSVAAHKLVNQDIASAEAPMHFASFASDFGMSRAALARALGYKPELFYAKIPATDQIGGLRLREFLAIVGRVEPWAGGRLHAMSWYRGQPIPALGNETAEALVQHGKAALVQSYLDAYEAGGYA